jgi:wyosine [tRNA(Phe)-imidazoG37] synthetase (radical SAM superfamily)
MQSNDIVGFHIEPTNICTLKCPKCSRTKFIEQFSGKWRNQQLNLEHLKNFIDIPIQQKLFTLCGDYGDPIYYDQLFELVSWIKHNGATVSLHTNGSYKTQEWWQQLTSYLDKNDTVVFAIDGMPENFTNYRINADWDSMLTGITETTSVTKTVWQYIPFSYNIDSISAAEQLSKSLGFTEFKLLQSSRWDSVNDPLRPDINFINQQDKEVKFKQNNKVNEIAPRCKTTNSDHFITAEGFYAPCCHVLNYNFYYKTEFYKNKSKFDISKTTLTHVLAETADFFNNLEITKPVYCTFNCPKL